MHRKGGPATEMINNQNVSISRDDSGFSDGKKKSLQGEYPRIQNIVLFLLLGIGLTVLFKNIGYELITNIYSIILVGLFNVGNVLAMFLGNGFGIGFPVVAFIALGIQRYIKKDYYGLFFCLLGLYYICIELEEIRMIKLLFIKQIFLFGAIVIPGFLLLNKIERVKSNSESNTKSINNTEGVSNGGDEIVQSIQGVNNDTIQGNITISGGLDKGGIVLIILFAIIIIFKDYLLAVLGL